ncbi:MAG TPA: hypothetical protein VHX86_09130 [Tepidisphaeraceae bacterium]|jgi:hypothetical protein|nr:hypothetical protein [Tepidisphaeraceae bacterium]
MPMIRIGTLVAVLSVAGCASNPYGRGNVSPDGRYADAGNFVPVAVRTQWEYDLRPRTQAVVPKYLRFPTTARFDDQVSYEGYYDSNKNITWVAVYGNVTCSSDIGQVDHNGYYVRWQQPGRVREDSGSDWQLMDVQILDQPY